MRRRPDVRFSAVNSGYWLIQAAPDVGLPVEDDRCHFGQVFLAARIDVVAASSLTCQVGDPT